MMRTLRELYDKINEVELTYLHEPIIKIDNHKITIIVDYVTEKKLQTVNKIFEREGRVEAYNDRVHITYCLPSND